MKNIAIYGAGGFGREVACMLRNINQLNDPVWNIVGFFDDGKEIGAEVGSFGKILGGIEELNNWSQPLNVALCFGKPQTVKNVRKKITNPNISFPNLIAPDFAIADRESFFIGVGNIIKERCGVTTGVRIGNFNLFNGAVSIGHDVTIGDFNTIMPGARISGEVRIGDENLLGADCFIQQQLHIGENVSIFPLSSLLTKPKNGCSYIGNPAKKFDF